MAKRCFLLLAALALALTLTGCSAGNRDYYEEAQLYLGSGEYLQAEAIFRQLGEYEDAGDYALYAAALAALERGDVDLARADFRLVAPFKSSERYLTYLDALALEESGQEEAALALWEELGSFGDSAARAGALREKIPAGEIARAQALMDAGRYDQAKQILQALNGYGESGVLLARCEEELLLAAYDRADALWVHGEYEAAMAAFEALGDALDSAERARACRAEMYRVLERGYGEASLTTAARLIEGYAEMEDYGESPARLAALRERFAVNLALAGQAEARPFVRFGQWLTSPSGDPEPLLWRLTALDGAEAVLVCERPAEPSATFASRLMFSPDEQAAILSLDLPLRGTLATSAKDSLFTPVPQPTLRLNLDDFAFTAGTGTEEDPFR